MSPVSWIVALSIMVGTVRAQELGGDEHPPVPSPVLDELRRLRARVDALENAHSTGDAPMAQSSIDLSGEELTSIQSPAENHVLSRPWFENVDLSGYAAFTYLDTGGEGTSPDGSFLVKEASLFVDAEIWDRVFFHDETWIVRFPNSDQFMVGELYANMRNVFAAEEGDGLGLKVGRFELPFGEDYLRWDANETRWISFTAADPYGIDEGVEIYGALGGAHWFAAITIGSGGGNGSDDGPAKLGALKLYGNPGQDLYTSLSLLTTGSSTRTALRLSGTSLTPVGAGGAASALGASPSEQVDTSCWEVDARIAESRRVNVGLQFGQAFIDDDVSAFDRDLSWFTIEPCFRLTDKVELLLRYSEIGTDDSAEGYSFSGKPIAQGEDFGFDTHRLRRLSGGACWFVNPHVTGKLEVGHDWLDLIDASTLDAQDDERLYFGVELVVSF
jgi:hypothetical protein